MVALLLGERIGRSSVTRGTTGSTASAGETAPSCGRLACIIPYCCLSPQDPSRPTIGPRLSAIPSGGNAFDPANLKGLGGRLLTRMVAAAAVGALKRPLNETAVGKCG
jgi:hypothetical protein